MTPPATATVPASRPDVDPDHAIVIAASQGDRSAFALLHARYAPMVHGVLLARVPPGEAADLVQDVFVQAMRHAHRLRDPGAFGPWLATIARNTAVKFHRRRRRTGRIPLALVAPETPDREATRTRANEVLRVINTLPAAYRETLVLRLVEGLTGPEIAGCTGRSHDSVRVNLHRGFRLLRDRLGLDPDTREEQS